VGPAPWTALLKLVDVIAVKAKEEAELELHEHADCADIIAVVKRRDVELVNTQTKLDKLLSPCMTIATSESRIHLSCILPDQYRWKVNLLDMTDGIKVDHYFHHSFSIQGSARGYHSRSGLRLGATPSTVPQLM
jgi:hypothetical protein